MKNINVSESPQNDGRVSRRDVVRKWSVRKVRRRPHNKEKIPKSETIIEQDSPNTSRESVIFFGENTHYQLLNDSFFVSSDEDSATSEDSKKFSPLVRLILGYLFVLR